MDVGDYIGVRGVGLKEEGARTFAAELFRSQVGDRARLWPVNIDWV